MKPLFTEKQRFNQWWLWLLLTVSSIAPIIGLYREYINRSSFQNIRLSSFIIIFSVFLILAILRLKTTITQQNIQLTYFPFVWKTIKLSDIETMKVINYGFVGGWGIRLWTKYGTVYNVRGNNGLHIRLNNGKQLVIGTQKPQELAKVVELLNSK